MLTNRQKRLIIFGLEIITWSNSSLISEYYEDEELERITDEELKELKELIGNLNDNTYTRFPS